MTQTARVLLKRSVLALSLGFVLAGSVAVLKRARATQPKPSIANVDTRVCAHRDRPPPRDIPTSVNDTAPDYDPVILLTNKVGRGYQLFERESRNDIWAAEMEREMRARLVEALGPKPGRRVDDVECRRSSCRVVISALKDDAHAATLAIEQPLLGDWFSLDVSEDLPEKRFAQQGFYFFSKAHRDISEYRRQMDKRIARARERKRSALPSSN